METDSNGNPTSYYVYGKGLISKGNASGDNSYYHYDRRGSTVALTNNSGEVTDTYTYDIYGEQLTKEGETPNRFLYNGKYGVQTDSNGLYYMRARYYNPEIKRFINRDVIQGSILESQTFNRYVYVNGNPISYIDPFGLSREEDSSLLVNVWNFIIGDDINTLADPNASALEKVFAGVSIASNFIPGAGPAFKGLKVLTKGSKLLSKSDEAVSLSRLNKPYTSRKNPFDLNECNCLVAGTMVKTLDGDKPIEKVKVGDYVLSKDEETGKIDYQKVTGLFNKTSEELYTIKVGNEEIKATGEHPFWVAGKGWTLVEDLIIGYKFLTSDGQELEITDIIKSETQVTVYNFEVENFHTYFISDSQIWTHNCSLSPGEKIKEIVQPQWLKNSKRYKAVHFNSTTEIDGVEYDISRRVYQLKDLDPNKIAPNGKTNLELMKDGFAPYDNNGKMIILHHTIQEEVGPIAELSSATHQKYTKTLHGLKSNGDSFRNNEILNNQYNNFKAQYWRARAAEFIKKGGS